MSGPLRRLIGLDRRLDDAIARGRDNNFDLLRLVAALAVLFGHSFVLAAGQETAATIDPISRLLVPVAGFGESITDLAVDVFFVISGFLVARSFLTQPTLIGFIEARLLRIFPAAIVCSVLMVVVFAGFSDRPLAIYFGHPETWQFLLNNATLWKVEFDLPGVFGDNAYPVAVNGSLWTLPVELRAYLILTGLGIAGLLRFRHGANLVMVVLLVLFLAPEWSTIITRNEDKWRLFLFFFVGATFYVNRRYIPLGIVPALALLALYAVSDFGLRLNAVIFVVLVAYLTLAAALASPVRWADPGRIGDLSYGVYLYAFPVQQAVLHLQPGLDGWSLSLWAGAITLLFAAASWFFIEQRALRWKGSAARRWARQPG